METSKPWWASKTLWANIVAGILAVTGSFGILELDAETQTQLVVGIMAVMNIILRLVTKTGVTK